MEVVSASAHDFATITSFGSRGATSVRLADGSGEAHAYLLRFEPGGLIDRHEAGFGQLFVVLSGSGWVEGGDGERVDVDAGDVVQFACGEMHAKGSDARMTALMVQVRELRAPSGDAV